MARHLSGGAAAAPTSAAGVLEAVDAGARAALLLDPVLPADRHAQEEREDEGGMRVASVHVLDRRVVVVDRGDTGGLILKREYLSGHER